MVYYNKSSEEHSLTSISLCCIFKKKVEKWLKSPFSVADKYMFKNHINLFSKLISYVVLNSHQCFFHPYLLPSLFKNFKNGHWILCGRQISVRKSYQCFFQAYLLSKPLFPPSRLSVFLFVRRRRCHTSAFHPINSSRGPNSVSPWRSQT